ncbi:MAG: hypothetical protein OXG47_07635 [bacterium]|nr:hypothetical protein [bacterium]
MLLPASGCAGADELGPLGRRFDEVVPAISPPDAQAQGAATEPQPAPEDTAAAPGAAPLAAAHSETDPPAARSGGRAVNDPGDRAGAAPDAALDAAGARGVEAQGAPIPLGASDDGGAPPPEVATAILGAYAAFWDNYWDAASHPVDPTHPGIARFSTEPLRSRAAGVLLGRATEGIALRLPPDHGEGRIVRIEGWDRDGAELLDCFVDTAVLYEVSTGRVRNDEQATVVHLALMRREGGSWRVAEIFEQAIHTGRTEGCIMQANTPDTFGPTAPSPDGEADGAARAHASAW